MIEIKTFSSGGGCYHAQLRVGNIIWNVCNDSFNLLNCYDISNRDEFDWYDENMIFSKNIYKDNFSTEEKEIIRTLVNELRKDFPNIPYNSI